MLSAPIPNLVPDATPVCASVLNEITNTKASNFNALIFKNLIEMPWCPDLYLNLLIIRPLNFIETPDFGLQI